LEEVPTATGARRGFLISKGWVQAVVLVVLIEWLRLPGDTLFIAGGALPALYIAYLGIRHTVKQVTLDKPGDEILFTEIHTTDAAEAAGEAAAARVT
jgi:hypothetical protein